MLLVGQFEWMNAYTQESSHWDIFMDCGERKQFKKFLKTITTFSFVHIFAKSKVLKWIKKKLDEPKFQLAKKMKRFPLPGSKIIPGVFGTLVLNLFPLCYSISLLLSHYIAEVEIK